MSKFNENKFYSNNTGEEVSVYFMSASECDDTEDIRVGVLNRKFYNKETGELELIPKEHWRYGIYINNILVYATEPGCVILTEKDCKRIIRNGKFGFRIIEDKKIKWDIKSTESRKLREFASKLENSPRANYLLNCLLNNWSWVNLYAN